MSFSVHFHLRFIFNRIHEFINNFLNFCSFGFIPRRSTLTANSSPTINRNNLQNQSILLSASGFNSSVGCLNSSSSYNSTSSDSEHDINYGYFENRRRSQRSLEGKDLISSSSSAIATEAVAHSYEDITQPNYHNYLWLSSQWDQTDLVSTFYFLPNWVKYFKNGVSTTRSSSYSDPNSLFTDENFTSPASTHGSLTLFKFILNKYFSLNTNRESESCRNFFDFIFKISSLPDSFFPKRRINLPKRQKTLIIDLDETLIHSTAFSCADFDFMVEVLISRVGCLYYVLKRPHVDYFLDVVSNWYNLVIFTASLREYADPVIDFIDNGRKYFKKRFFRSSCTRTPSHYYLKDLSLIDSDLSKLCLLDNSAASFAIHPDNAIPIESWREDKNDTALLELLPFLDALRFVDDVRSILSMRRLSLFCNK